MPQLIERLGVARCGATLPPHHRLVLVLEDRTAYGVRGVDREPEGNCHFAGEHTSIDVKIPSMAELNAARSGGIVGIGVVRALAWIGHRLAISQCGNRKLYIIAPFREINKDAATVRSGDASKHRAVKMRQGC